MILLTSQDTVLLTRDLSERLLGLTLTFTSDLGIRSAKPATEVGTK